MVPHYPRRRITYTATSASAIRTRTVYEAGRKRRRPTTSFPAPAVPVHVMDFHDMAIQDGTYDESEVDASPLKQTGKPHGQSNRQLPPAQADRDRDGALQVGDAPPLSTTPSPSFAPSRNAAVIESPPQRASATASTQANDEDANEAQLIAEMRARVAATSKGAAESHYNRVDGGSPLEPQRAPQGQGPAMLVSRESPPGGGDHGDPGSRAKSARALHDVVAICSFEFAKIHQAMAALRQEHQAMAALRQEFVTATVDAAQSSPASSKASPATSKRAAQGATSPCHW